MKKLVLVDGSNLLFQMFYGMPARIVNRQGRPIHGTIGFIGALLKIFRMLEPTHAAVLFDGECSNPRRLADPDYKANREDYSLLPEEETPFSQLPDIFAALDHLGISWAETTDCETDDWMASYAKRCGADWQLTLVSQDSDYFQLIDEKTSVLRYRGEASILWNGACLSAKLGIAPEQYAAFKSLTGDVSDNIRGVEKVGPKTAAALLRQFGDLETLLARCEEISKPSVRKAVAENRQRILKNYALIRLDGRHPVPFEPESLTYTPSGLSSTQVLRAVGVLDT